eukprot:scaffold24225_cov48-Phaeocystis_antarctica.AAC.2
MVGQIRLTRGGDTPSRVTGQGFRGRFSGLAGARRGLWSVGPLSHSPRWREPSGATGADSVCSLSRYAARFGVRCAVGQHPPAATRGAAVVAGKHETARGKGVVHRGRRRRRRRRRAAQVWRGAHSRPALISADETHSFPSRQETAHADAGTIVTSLATPYFRPPTVEA